MELPTPTRKWRSLGDKNLQREHWQVSNPQWRCCDGDAWAVAPLGCLVAIVSSRLDPSSSLPENVKCQLRIFRGGSYALITSVPWLVRLETLLALQWTDTALLVAVFKNACVRVFSPHGEFVQHFYLYFSENEPRSVLLDPSMVVLSTWGAGVIYVSKDTSCLYLQRGFDGRDCIHFSLGDYSLRVSALGVIPREEWLDSIVIMSRLDGACYIAMHDVVKCRDIEDFERFAHEIDLPSNTTYDEIVLCTHAVSGYDRTYFAFRDRATGSVASMCYYNGGVQMLWHGKVDPTGSLYVVGNGVLALAMGISGGVSTVGDVDGLLVDTGSNTTVASDTGTGNTTGLPGNTTITGDSTSSATSLPGNSTSTPVANGIRFIDGTRSNDDLITTNFSTSPCCITSDVGGGIRLFTQTRVEFFKIVSDCSEKVFSPASCSPAAVLLRAYGMFHSGDVKACETLRLIRDDIAEAVDVCIGAAVDCWDFDTASMLLDAAAFGRSMASVHPDGHTDVLPGLHSSDNTTDLVVSAQASPESVRIHPRPEEAVSSYRNCISRTTAVAMLRVANSLAAAPSEIRTNASQLLSLGPRLLVHMLAAQNCHLLALRISDFLGFDKNQVLLHWVRTRVKLGSHMTDIELVEAITRLLDGYAGVVLPYADIASAVARERRSNLALALLDREKSLPRRFRTLCSWGELSKAACVAAEACDLMYAAVVVLEAQQGSNLDRLVELASANTCVRDVFIKQCHLAGAADILQIFLERIDDIYGAGLNAARQALSFLRPAVSAKPKPAMHQLVSHINTQSNTQAEDCSTWLKFSADFFASVAASKGANSDSAKLWHECISQQRELLSVQTELERSSPALANSGLIGRSLVYTVFCLYRLDRAKEASALAARFNMPFNQHWRCRLAAAHDVHNINDLLRMANDKAAHAQYVTMKNGKPPVDLVLEALLSLGATSAVESVASTLRYPQQQQWRSRLNARVGGSVPQNTGEDAPSLLSSISKRIWQS
ncbi:vacuolar sorting protein [Babesia ovis]|uniref:Vacuolar sorting protein n=1 Tax=Babesia ovis TaxID=5869 RepID=A0A9W5TAE1_BABOV|nr:vacuolar sorting protein [Babesia ovis]